MQISITIEAMFGLNWPLWKHLIARVEAMGFYGLYRSDHFMVGKAGSDSLELVTSLAYLADHSERVQFGSLVSPLSFHHPALLARQAMAINDLSGGRMILGVGAGWHDAEHEMFGYHLGDKPTRLGRFAEGVEVIRHLTQSDAPLTFAGRYFQLREARLLPRSPVRLMIGGNGATRTLPLVARFADVWNGQVVEPEVYGEINRRLDGLVEAAGRAPGEVKRTVIVPVIVTRGEADLKRHIAAVQQHAAPFNQAPDEEVKGWLYGLKGIIGSPQQVVDGLAAYGDCGAAEVIIEWFGLYDLEGFELLGSEVLSKLAG